MFCMRDSNATFYINCLSYFHLKKVTFRHIRPIYRIFSCETGLQWSGVMCVSVSADILLSAIRDRHKCCEGEFALL